MELDAAEMHRLDEDATTSLWSEVVAGGWSVVEEFEADGRRWFVAQRASRDFFEALTPRERTVVTRTVAGHSNKVIAIDLGLAPSTVAGHLASAMRKLGTTSRVELVRAHRWLDLQSEFPRGSKT
ncbi:MAG: LuxR C-terminal-related transcriptional regulator [Polyangiales bacterium]